MKLDIPLSMSTGSFYPKTTAHAMRRIHDLGLTRIELVIQDSELGYGFFREVNSSHFNRLVQVVERHDLRVVSLHAPFFSGHEVFSSRAREEILLNTLDIASLFGANEIVVHPYHFFRSYEGLVKFLSSTSSSPYRWVLPKLKSILRNAEERGVNLAVENVGHWHDHTLLNDPRNLMRIIKSFHHGAIRADIDIYHSEFAGNTSEFLSSLSDSIISLHVSDISESRERTLPGTGGTNWGEVFRLASSLRSLQHTILEVTDHFDDGSIRKSIAYLERVIKNAGGNR